MDASDLPQEDPDNLIARVDSDSLQAARQAFPPAESATVDVIHVPGRTIDGVEVLVSFERYGYRHNKNRFWAWRMARAVLVDAAGAGSAL